jgi:hypothetical protein
VSDEGGGGFRAGRTVVEEIDVGMVTERTGNGSRTATEKKTHKHKQREKKIEKEKQRRKERERI